MNDEPGLSRQNGSFSTPSFLAIGDPYRDPYRAVASVHKSLNEPKFLCNSGLKKGQTGDNWGPGTREFMRLTEGDTYKNPGKYEIDIMLSGRAAFREPFGFKYANPMKTSSCSGDYHGSFTSNIEHFSDETHGQRGNRTKIEELLEKRNILTSPMKKGTYGFYGNKIGGLGNE
jgi:hypothetical protein